MPPRRWRLRGRAGDGGPEGAARVRAGVSEIDPKCELDPPPAFISALQGASASGHVLVCWETLACGGFPSTPRPVAPGAHGGVLGNPRMWRLSRHTTTWPRR